MKIDFDIDAERKKVSFFVKQGELNEWLKDTIKRFPELDQEQLSKRDTHILSEVMGRALKEICESNNIEDWKDFVPHIVFT